MAEILRYGAYLPRYRTPVKELHEFYGRPGRPRARTLATPALDEDSLTMAYEAAVGALGDGASPQALLTVMQAPPFGLRKVSGTLAGALGVAGTIPFDLGGNAAGLLDAFALAGALVDQDPRPVLVVAADHLVSYEERVVDTLSAGGASAFLVGASGGFCRLGPSARAYEEVYDVWRLGTEPEPRYRLEVLFDAYAKTAKAALETLAASTERPTANYAAVCPSQPHPQALRALGRQGVAKEQLENTSFVGEIGNLGAASVGIALALGLDAAEQGQQLLVFGYGGGEGIAQAIEVTDGPPAIGAAEMFDGQEIDLGTYYRWTRGRQVAPH